MLLDSPPKHVWDGITNYRPVLREATPTVSRLVPALHQVKGGYEATDGTFESRRDEEEMAVGGGRESKADR